MNFEEQFPELKYKTIQISFDVERHNGHKWRTDEHYTRGLVEEADIQKHCLSKQRVKEAILFELEEWRDDLSNWTKEEIPIDFAKSLMKKLGLED